MAAQAFNLTFNCTATQFATAMATTLPTEGYTVIQAPSKFAGNKGFHLYIDEDFFGFDHDEYCAKHFKEVEIDLIHEIGVEIDLKITHANRKFRIPGSKHPKSHLYKTEIPLDLLNISEIKNLASNPQTAREALRGFFHIYATNTPPTTPEPFMEGL